MDEEERLKENYRQLAKLVRSWMEEEDDEEAILELRDELMEHRINRSKERSDGLNVDS
jgi:hypothetical protein